MCITCGSLPRLARLLRLLDDLDPQLEREVLALRDGHITPELARGLALAQEWGVIVSDVMPGGPADVAGLCATDVIVSIDDKPIDSLPLIAFHLYTRRAGDRLRMDVLRGDQHMTLDVAVIDRPDAFGSVNDLIDPDKSAIPRLGILGVSVDQELGLAIPSLRVPSGVLIAAHTEDRRAAGVSLSVGDIIHSVNGASVSNIEELRRALDSVKAQSPVVLHIERDGVLSFVAFELE